MATPRSKLIRIPAALRPLAGNQETLEVHAATVAEALAELQARHPEIRERLWDDSGALHRFVNIYLNEDDIRSLQGQQTPLQPGDELSLIPAIAGG